ncbi:hypothetical protein [Microcoleus vaginatus]|uniref:hypothetical protein n=1 Tax=Microcoleus vaginatus TaxID=119532 RepID=UPI001685A46F|nr:hypothetical protein [Microcoleus sp. FACHB-84]MBD2012224.1 hypothetical protein [Microcoleus sp. FACHB-45]
MRQGFQSLSDCRIVGLSDRPRLHSRPDCPLQVDRPYPKIRRGLKSPSRERKSVKTD